MSFLAALVLSATITTIPATPLVETTRSGQALNFDLVIQNTGEAKLVVEEIEATVLDAKGAMVTQRRLQQNGKSLDTLPAREVAPGKRMVIFNPFHTFEAEYALHQIRYVVSFADGTKESITVAPQLYRPRAELILPVVGRVFVHDGHDFYSHHRRLDVTGDMTSFFKINENMTRYAHDFTIVDETGAMFRDDGDENEEWYGFGSPILAPADGVVLSAANIYGDSSKKTPVPLDREAVMKDLRVIFGNYVLLDHGNGEISLLAHLKQGSVPVKAGDRVKRGQQIGAMGASGDALFPHLHYQLQRDVKFGDGLPAYFRDFQRYTGNSWTRVATGTVDTGDVLQTAPRK